MADSRTDILISLLDYLDRLDERLSYFVRSNRASIARTESQVADTFAQIARHDNGGEPVVRKNRLFFLD